MANFGQPELIIGVDFGMSQTGVAYCTAPWTNPNVFQKWSGIGAQSFDKVPTRLAYVKDTRNIKSWGFFVDVGDRESEIKEYFKLNLDPKYREYDAITNQEAKRWFRDYLICIHGHVAEFFKRIYPQWGEMPVEWIFSVPTTWKHAGMVRELQSIMEEAGFGKDGPNHSCAVTLTEAEAAAISGAQQLLKPNDVVMVCDAGGGTTDVNIMKIKSDVGNPLEVDQLIEVEGREIGSALIDIQVQQHLVERLKYIEIELAEPTKHIAEKMMAGRFERFKCDFGNKATTIAPSLFLPVVGLPGRDYEQAGIRDSQMEISRVFIQGLFDDQVNGMITLIEEQLQRLRRRHPGEKVSYLIMSGGLSASEYIQSLLRAHFERGQGAGIANAPGLKILMAENLQLAVVKGLVKYRAQQIGQQITPIVKRCAPVSYGVVVNQRYNSSLHFGQRVVRDPRDKKKWAIDQIEWLIRKGDAVTNEGIERTINAKFKPGQRWQKPWVAQFVMSTRDEDPLPRSMADSEFVRHLCNVKVDLDKVERVRRNHHWWNFGEQYDLAQFRVKLVPGFADLKFRFFNKWNLNSIGEDRITVKWGSGIRTQSLTSIEDLDKPYL